MGEKKPRQVPADQIPTPEELDRAGSQCVDDEDGSQRPFEGLIRRGKTVVVFIRHFHCSLCQEYLAQLSTSITPEMLSAKGVKLVVIGCGHWSTIKPYREVVGCPFPFYADPTRALYDELDLKRTMIADTGPSSFKASYGKSTFGATVLSIQNMWKMGRFVHNGGHFGQLGGEFIFEEGKCVFAHRMQHTRDHVPVAKLAQLLDIRPGS